MPPEIELSKDQSEAFDDISEWYVYHQQGVPFLTMGGFAGTGKTTLMSYLYNKFNHSTIAYCAYTGKAASVLRAKLNERNENIETNCSVSTIHSLIYKPKLDAQGKIIGWVRKPNIDADLVIIDEASMVGLDNPKGPRHNSCQSAARTPEATIPHHLLGS